MEKWFDEFCCAENTGETAGKDTTMIMLLVPITGVQEKLLQDVVPADVYVR